MEMIVEDLIDELKKCNPRARVHFQTGYNSNGVPHVEKSVQRIDNFGGHVNIVIEKGI